MSLEKELDRFHSASLVIGDCQVPTQPGNRGVSLQFLFTPCTRRVDTMMRTYVAGGDRIYLKNVRKNG